MADRVPVIKIDNLVKEYSTTKTVTRVLHGINLEIYFSEFVILFGPSGCGKSTLLNCIAGLETPTAGKVYIRGDDMSKYNKEELALHRCAKIGMIFQQFNVLKSMNVLRNIALPQVFKGLPRKRRLKRSYHMLEMVGMEKYAKYIPTELSGGQQQRIAIARALVNNPWILLADEPTGNLDSKNAEEVMTLLQRLNDKSKRTLVLVTHNPDHLRFADKVVFMRDGLIEKIKVVHDKSRTEMKDVEEEVVL